MAYYKKIGVLLESPVTRSGAAGLVPPLSAGQAEQLYLAFTKDLLARLDRLKKCAGTIFYRGDNPEILEPYIPRHYVLVPQEDSTPGERLHSAFQALLQEERDVAVIIGINSPDVPLQYIKRAFLKLKHKDVVLGPAAGGGHYLAGLKFPPPNLFAEFSGTERSLLNDTLETIGRDNLALAIMPLWYRVDDIDRLSLLRTMMRAKTIEKSGRLMHTEHELERIFSTGEK